MLSGTYGQKHDPFSYFIEGARKEWVCRMCGDADRIFFVIRRKGAGKEQPICIPCVLHYPKRFPAGLISKLDAFVVMERLRDSGKKEEGV